MIQSKPLNKKTMDKDNITENLRRIISGENDEISVMANACAFLRKECGYFWVGFYIVKGDELTLGPFQGDIACYRIKKGRGVCGTAWDRNATILVDDVEKFPGHIACSSLSKSEIVVPLRDTSNQVKAVLDIDSDKLNGFNEEDKSFLENIALMMSKQIYD